MKDAWSAVVSTLMRRMMSRQSMWQSHLLHADDEQAGAQIHPSNHLKTKPWRHKHLLAREGQMRSYESMSGKY